MIGKMIAEFIVILTGMVLVLEREKSKETKIIKPEKHKQTYEEYVKERLKVEKLLK